MCVIQINEKHYPWERGQVIHSRYTMYRSTVLPKANSHLHSQVVVELSRNETCDYIVIVGPRDFAIRRMYQTLCQHTQWTALTERIVENISITVNESREYTPHFFDMANENPLRASDMSLPNTNSGFVYMLISTICPEQIYVGQTANVAVRLNAHNSGRGSEGTSFIRYLPWSVAGYMTGMSHMTESERMSLEYRWKVRNRRSVERGRVTTEQYLDNGRQVLDEYNADVPATHPEHKLNFVACVQRQFAPELFDRDPVLEEEEGDVGSDLEEEGSSTGEAEGVEV